VSAIKRLNRSTQIDRAGELQESDSPEFDQELAQAAEDEALAALQLQRRFQDRFDPAASEQLLAGVDAANKRPPVELNLFDRVLTTEDFEQRLQETLDGTSERAQQVKQVEAAYEVYFKDTEDFPVANVADVASVANAQARTVTASELPRYEAPAETAWKGRAMTVPEFQAITLPEAASTQQAAQTSAALLESQLAAEEAAEPLSLLGRVKPRA
jgi:hypothetical protein